MTYEYICTACAFEWEASQPISDPALTTCPKCKQEAAKRQISGGTGFVLKGGGWYADLYSSGGAAKPEEKAGEGETKAPAADSSNETPKPEKKKKADAPSKPSPSKASAD